MSVYISIRMPMHKSTNIHRSVYMSIHMSIHMSSKQPDARVDICVELWTDSSVGMYLDMCVQAI